MTKDKTNKDEKFIADAKEKYNIAYDGWRHIYEAAVDDTKFVYDVDDGQWPADVRKARGTRPIITVNKLQKFSRKNRGKMMQNRPRIKVIPVDSVSDPQVAELYDGLIREIEYRSGADIVYRTAYGHAVDSSVGYFRLVTEFEDEKSFNQHIRIKRIIDPTTVLIDPDAQEFNLEDAKYAFIESSVKKDEFKESYPNAEVYDFSGNSQIFGDWLDNDNVRICEYFYKESVVKKLALLESGETVELTPEKSKLIVENGLKVVRERVVNSHVVKWVKMTGAEILEKGEWPGMYIPIIPVFGEEVVVNGKRYYISLMRGAKGPQQMYNYWASAGTENVALTPKAHVFLDARQIAGYEREWDEANTSNRIYLRYKGVPGLQKPSKEPQAQVPTAIISMLQTTAYDIEDHLGMYEAAKGEASNERSGKAIKERATQSDQGTYTFVDNFNQAIIYAGKQIIDLIPKIYDTQRAISIMGETGEHQMVPINTPVSDGMGGTRQINDLTVGKYDIISTAGASSASKREEMVQSMIEACQYAPDVANIIVPFIFKYSDWPGSNEVYQEIKKYAEQQAMMAQMGQAQ